MQHTAHRSGVRWLSVCFALSIVIASCGVNPTIPAELEAVEAATESAFDKTLVGDFTTARSLSADLSASWSQYRSRALRDNAPPSAIDAIDRAVETLPAKLAGTPDVIEASRAVNEISAPMSQLYALYDPSVPVDVLDLDHLGREVLLDALGGDLVRAGRDIDRVASTWSILEPKVAAAGGTAEIAQMQATIADARAALDAGNPAEVEVAARAELEVVDAIEAIFAANGDTAD